MYVATIRICRGKWLSNSVFKVSRGLLATIVAQGMVLKAPYFRASFEHITVQKVPDYFFNFDSKIRSI